MKLILVFILIVGLSSCFKKSNQTPDMTSNHIDTAYSGGVWCEFSFYQNKLSSDSIPYVRYNFSELPEMTSNGAGSNYKIIKDNLDSSIVLPSKFGIDSFDLVPGNKLFRIGVYRSSGMYNVFELNAQYNG
ncbi:MAG: hypothetical protein ACI857_001022 [Arenicella sp.]|jgi:hypothetical protein